MTFDAFGFLGGIVAALPSLIGGADRLAVQNGGGIAAFAGVGADGTAQHIVNDLPKTLLAPPPEVMTNRFPRSKVAGQQPPGATRPDKIKQGVANSARICRRATAMPGGFARRQNRLQQVPLFISQISRIQSVIHPASL